MIDKTPFAKQDDAVALVARYAPSRRSLTTWTQEREDDVLDYIAHNSWWDELTEHPDIAALPTDLEPPARRRGSRRASVWAPALAAACVLALVVGLAYAFDGGHRETSTGPRLPALSAHPWHARALGKLPVAGGVIGHGSRLYVQTDADKPALLEVDRTSGAVLNRAALPSNGSIDGPVSAGGRVWVATQPSPHHIRLSGFVPDLSRAVHRTITAPVIMGNVLFGLTAPADGSALYVSTGRHVLVLDPGSGRIESLIALSADELSVSPDGATLYVIDVRRTAVTAIDTRTHRVLARRPVAGSLDEGGGQGEVARLAATDAGYFVTAVLTKQPDNLTHLFYNTAEHTRVEMNTGRDTAVSSPTHATGGISWGSGGTHLSCVDPATGRILDRSRPYRRAFIDVTDVDGHLYGTYAGSPTGPDALIELTPPKACGLS